MITLNEKAEQYMKRRGFRDIVLDIIKYSS